MVNFDWTMLFTVPVQSPERIPAVTHVDYSARVQTVTREDNPRYYDLIKKFEERTGCAVLVRATALRQAGLLDERFFMYYEEVEWCVRTRRAGFRIVHVPQAHIWHKIAPSAQSDSPRVHYYMTRNRLLFLKASGAGWRAWVHTLFAEYLRTLISWSVKGRWRHKQAHRASMLRAIVDASLGRWGERAEKI